MISIKHLGDICKINGHDVPLVDVVCGGSPCQDLSVAGKRAGLAGQRSGLFMDQIRIIKEMRDESRSKLHSRGADVDLRLIQPRYMVWENVPGAFSSNGGEDFRAVLEETARVVCEDAVIPKPSGRWSTSGCIMGDGWSIAWRVHDAQFWGVPQRRKRISLVADFGGESAPEILFEREGVSGDPEQGEQKGEETSRGLGASPDETSYTLKVRGGVEFDRYGKRAGKGALIQTELSGTLGVSQDQTLININGKDREAIATYAIDQGAGKSSASVHEETSPTLATTHQVEPAICYGISSYESNAMKSSNPYSGIYEADTSRTLDVSGGNPACNQGGVVVLEGNGARESHKGPGFAESDVMYSLNTVEQHKVCYQQTTGTLSPGAHAGSYNGQDAYNDMLIVARKTSFGSYAEDDAAGTLKECGGDIGGERIVGDTVGALCARDFKGVGNQYVNEGKCIIQHSRPSDT